MMVNVSPSKYGVGCHACGQVHTLTEKDLGKNLNCAQCGASFKYDEPLKRRKEEEKRRKVAEHRRKAEEKRVRNEEHSVAREADKRRQMDEARQRMEDARQVKEDAKLAIEEERVAQNPGVLGASTGIAANPATTPVECASDGPSSKPPALAVRGYGCPKCGSANIAQRRRTTMTGINFAVLGVVGIAVGFLLTSGPAVGGAFLFALIGACMQRRVAICHDRKWEWGD